jgi:hypothetical protein
MIPLLQPGEEITRERLNKVIAAVNAGHITSSDFPVERTGAGTKLKLARRPQDFYAEIIEPLDSDAKPIRPRDSNDEIPMGEYEWREVFLPAPSDADESRYGNQSLFRELPDGRGSVYDATYQKLHNPAYELSGDYHVPIGTLVRMRVYQPAVENDARERGFLRRYVFHHVNTENLFLAQALADWEENGVYPDGNPRVRCQQLIADPDTEPTATEPHPKKAAGNILWVELPRERKGDGGIVPGLAHSTDPAVYFFDRIYYSYDDQGRAICQSPYLHMGKIGQIWMLGKLPSNRAAIDAIPTGCGECNGDVKHGNAGEITLANFDRDHTALSGNADTYGAGPVHKSSTYAVGDQCMHATFDAHGESTFARVPIATPPGVAWYDTSEELAAPDNHRHDIKAAQGEFPQETVFFYQRYK